MIKFVDMRHASSLLLVFLVLLSMNGISSAHQPRIVKDITEITVSDPEISKAYYGELNGKPAVYRIKADRPFMLYVNLLVPDLPGIKKDVSALVIGNRKGVAVLDGIKFKWSKYFEPFGGDHYYKGPELRKEVPAGDYNITVHSPDNRGKYVLAIGEKESFPLNEMIAAYAAMPVLKKDFFNASPWLAFNNYLGVFLLFLGAVLIAVISLVFLLWKKIYAKNTR